MGPGAELVAIGQSVTVVVVFGVARVKGVGSPTRFRLRVLVSRTYGKVSERRNSPLIVSALRGGAPATCGNGSDFDGDLLPNSVEAAIKTDPCNKDTDGDGVEDGFEQESARDLNQRSLATSTRGRSRTRASGPSPTPLTRATPKTTTTVTDWPIATSSAPGPMPPPTRRLQRCSSTPVTSGHRHSEAPTRMCRASGATPFR